jgi:large subunit ribosomal protein L35
MPSRKMKTHKGAKKRFKVSANGKVTHKKCGSSHLMSHKSGKQVRKLRRKKILKVEAEAHRLRRSLRKNESRTIPEAVAAEPATEPATEA